MSRGTSGWRELVLVVIAAAALTACLTYPFAFKIGHIGRVDNGDGQFSIWNVAWVARALVADPRHVFDANIFYPHRDTLAYSENNLGAGALAVPVYWATHNPYAAHNFALLAAFVLSATAMYSLVRYLTRDRRAAAISGIAFAFCPYVFAHLPHIQLLMTAGLAFSMLAFHRLTDAPTIGRGAVLGAALAGQALCCGYYGVFVALMTGYGVLVTTLVGTRSREPRFWLAVAVAALVAVACVAPAFRPYWSLSRVEGFHRSLDEARLYSANWSAYLASSAYAHAWMLRFLPPWREVVFPGFVATALGATGLWTARRERGGEVLLLYGGLLVLAFWASFGPGAELYSLLYAAVPLFAWLRAPARFGLIVSFALCVLAGYGTAALLRRPRLAGVAPALIVLAAAELVVPLEIPEALPVEPVYQRLASQPRGALLEMPFWYLPPMFPRHTFYMIQSTAHWMPLVNGYSDYMPPDFFEHVLTLAPFPSHESFKLLEASKVRYVIFHMYWYNDDNRRDVLQRLEEFEPYLRPIYAGEGTRLYEIVSFPP
jgi:hypothetical protein